MMVRSTSEPTNGYKASILAILSALQLSTPVLITFSIKRFKRNN
jgi:hypothetical protein